jgi:hypothetical protein
VTPTTRRSFEVPINRIILGHRKQFLAVFAVAGLGLSLIVALAASSSGSAAVRVAKSARPASVVAPSVSCASLASLDLTSNPAALAQVTSAAETTFNGGDFCKVVGQIAPQEDFELLLPVSTWTGGYVQEGNGGQGGSASISAPTLATGCMPVTNNNLVIGADDEGHEGPGSLWAATDPAILADYAYLSEHLLAVTAKAVINTYYGSGPTDSYFDGCSTGGRQALVEAQRFPTDFQGILAGSPTYLNAELPSELHMWDILSNTDSSGHEILTSAQLPALHAAVMEACANGQGVITDPRSCDFNPGSLTCPAAQVSDNCLTPAQVQVVDKLYRGPSDPQGQLLYPGGLAFGSELAWAGELLEPASDSSWPLDTQDGSTANSSTRYETLTAGPESPSWKLTDWKFTRAQYKQLDRGLIDAVDPDLSAFARAGGKLILWAGAADQAVPPMGTIAYYAAVEHAAGGFAAASRFSRLYMIPGGYHCEEGGDPESTGDLLTALVGWVQGNTAPGTETFTTVNPTAGQPAQLNVSPLDALAPVPGGRRSMNNDYSKFIGGFPSGTEEWTETNGRNFITRRGRTDPFPNSQS